MSIVTEFITWINKKVTGTVFQGQGAFLLALIVGVVAAVIKVMVLPYIPGTLIQSVTAQFSLIFAASQVFFYWIIKTFGLNVGSSTT